MHPSESPFSLGVFVQNFNNLSNEFLACFHQWRVQGIYFQRSVTEILVLFIYLIFYH